MVEFVEQVLGSIRDRRDVTGRRRGPLLFARCHENAKWAGIDPYGVHSRKTCLKACLAAPHHRIKKCFAGLETDDIDTGLYHLGMGLPTIREPMGRISLLNIFAQRSLFAGPMKMDRPERGSPRIA